MDRLGILSIVVVEIHSPHHQTGLSIVNIENSLHHGFQQMQIAEEEVEIVTVCRHVAGVLRKHAHIIRIRHPSFARCSHSFSFGYGILLVFINC